MCSGSFRVLLVMPFKNMSRVRVLWQSTCLVCWHQQNKTIPSRNGFWDWCSNCRYPGIHGDKALFLVTGLVAHW